MSKLENVITKIRNILRSEGITGMDSINHCIVFLLCRMLDEKICKKTNIDIKYAFTKLTKDENNEELGDHELYTKFYKRRFGEESLVGELFNKIGFRNIKFKLVGIQDLRSVINELKKLDVEQLSSKCDLIGSIYEYHLKSGTSNSLRDLGQYYTNRQVIDFMVKLCDPKIKDNGMLEKIVDPTMGTAGFLVMAIKHIEDKYKNIDWSKQKNSIIGFDIDENVRNMALVNVLLETGELLSDTLVKRDTLKEDLKFESSKILQKVDIVLANEPMGLKNIKYDECCDTITQLGIKGTKAEPLFVQLFMEHLNDGGRCCVIVPDGFLFNENKLYSGTREYLMKNFDLKKVISLNDDFFLNTGVKTSILYFENTEYMTSKVEFSELKLKDGKVCEKSILKVKIKDIENNKYSLFVNKYIVAKVEKIENVEYKKLGELCDFLQKSKRAASFGKDIGKYPFYTSSRTVKRCDECDYDDECIIIGTGGNANVKYDKKFSCSADNIILKPKKNNCKFIYYYLLTHMNLLENGFAGSTIKHISKDYINNIEIPIPSISIQNKIVEQLDIISRNIENGNNMICEYNEIIKYYVKVHTRSCNEMLLSSVAELNSENVDFSHCKFINYIDIGSINEGIINNIKYLDKEYPSRAKRIVRKKDIILSTVRPNLRNYAYIEKDIENCVCSTGFCVIRAQKKKNILNKMLYYHIISDEVTEYLIQNAIGSQYPAVNVEIIGKIKIKIPNIENQEKIVKYCDNLMGTIKKIKNHNSDNIIMMKDIINTYISN